MEIREIEDPRLVKALAHPLRIQILRVLSGRMASPSEIAAEISARLPNVAYHVRFLERMGLIELVRTRPRRGAVEHYYRTRGRLRITSRVWSQVPDAIKSAVIDAALAQAITEITAAASAGGFNRGDSLSTRRSMALDEQGFREISTIFHDALDTAGKVEEESRKRLAAGNHAVPEIKSGLVIALFEATAEEDQPAQAPRQPAPQPSRKQRRTPNRSPAR
jgi:DNA-binding transcriptional ArsR family regulator